MRSPVRARGRALQPAFEDVGGRAHGCGNGAGSEGGEDVGWRVVLKVQEGRGEEVGFGGGVAAR